MVLSLEGLTSAVSKQLVTANMLLCSKAAHRPVAPAGQWP